ncbi:MAG: F0F1 ATP synthase subunit A [Candidatus Dormibacteria bacterium]|jgi:F-type H+-transporting ATPase subunit a
MTSPLIGLLLADTPPGTHPTVSICGGGGFLCTYDYDTLISSGIAVAVTLVIGFVLARTVRSGKPGRLQMVFELFLSYVRSLIRQTVGEDAPAFLLPLAATIGFFILVANWLDFFPLQQPVEPANADLNLPLAMGLIVFILSQAYAIGVRGLGGYLRHFTKPEEMNIVVRILFLPLNLIEEVVKPITLALRLFGNIFAGVVMVYLLGSLFEAWVGASVLTTALSPLAIIGMTVWKLFDVLFIGSIQAFIFMLLTIIYFGQAREGVGEEGYETRSPA